MVSSYYGQMIKAAEDNLGIGGRISMAMDSSQAPEGQKYPNLVKTVNDKGSKGQKSFKNSTSGFSEPSTALSDSEQSDDYNLCYESDRSDGKKGCNDADSGPVSRDRVKKGQSKADITEESRSDETRMGAKKAEQSRTNQTKTGVNKTEGNRADETRTEGNETEGSRTDETRTGVNKTEGSRTDETRAGVNKTEGSRTDETRAGVNKTEGSRTDETRAGVNKTEGSRTDETRTGVNKTEGSRTDETRTEGSRTDETRTEGSRTDETRTEGSRTDETRTEGSRTDETKTGVNKTEGSRLDETGTEGSRLEENYEVKLNGTMHLGNHDPEGIEGRDQQGSKMESSTPDPMLSVEESEEGRSSHSELLPGRHFSHHRRLWKPATLVTGIGSPIKELTCIIR